MDETYADAYARLYREHWWWRVREQILLRKLDVLLAGSRDAKILDIGCGAGLFFDALDAYGHVEGVESDPITVQQSGRWRARIHLGQLDTLPPGAYDVILMLDVLEHLERPEAVLRQAVARLAPQGVVLITVPAFQWLWTNHDALNHHVKRFNSAELARLVRAVGLDLIELRYMFQSLVVPKLLVRAKQALSPALPSVPRIPRPAVNKAVTAWFQLENAIAGSLPFGSSLLAVARRAKA